MDVERQRHEVFQALLDPREAMTVAVRVQLSPSVIDTRIVAATPRAAALYGYNDPAELEGQFTSMVHVLEDIQRTRLRSTLRALGLVNSLEHYEVRLLQQSGAVQRVLKDVEQRQVEETMVWICRLEPADTRVPFQPPPLPESVPEDALHHFFGWACVAEMETLLRQQRLLLTSIPNMSIFRQEKAKSSPSLPQIPVEDARPVERLALHSPRVYYRYRCLVCGRDWVGGGHEEAQDAVYTLPMRCNYADCRAYVWNDPSAAVVARRKREQRLTRQRRAAPSSSWDRAQRRLPPQ